MQGFVDLHCHWIPGIDDGAQNLGETLAMLTGLGELGFELVVATPHMRPGMFDNTRSDLKAAFQKTETELLPRPGLPLRGLSAEHYLDDIVLGRLLRGEALPYPGEHAVLLEFYDLEFPPALGFRLADLRHRGLLPIVAHPERYPRIAKNPDLLQSLLEVGAAALLDVAALADHYGRPVRRCAELLLERGLYHAACSDAHRPSDLGPVAAGIRRLNKDWGDDTLQYLLHEGPRALLAGQVPV